MTWFGHAADALARALDLPRVVAEACVDSTMDRAHALASAGAGAGTLVLAEEQRAGRGRAGNRWTSAPRAGLWMTLIERPADATALDVLSLRVGLRLAPVLERWTAGPVQLKWPNDLFVHGAKLAGVLIEVRWRVRRPDWVAIGVGINLHVPAALAASTAASAAAAAAAAATALQDANPLEVLAEAVPAVRAAAAGRGSLREDELEGFARRDYAKGRRVESPAAGTACGITADGAILIASESGVAPWRAGSLILSA